MIMLTVNVHSGLSAVTLLCHGRIVLGLEAETLRCIVTARPEYRVIVDLQDVYRLDACGLGLLVELHCWAAAVRADQPGVGAGDWARMRT
jgi:hypothetical protein